MGKADRNRRQSSREKIAAQQAAARRGEARRRALIAGGSVVAVIAVVVALITAAALRKPASATAAAPAASSAVARQITTVPASTFNAVGTGTSSNLTTLSGQPALTAGGKPEVLYMGAEYCPYCAAERWAMVAALSRFGTFSSLHFIHSSSTDVYPSTPTLTFYKSGYSSRYVTFDPVEMFSGTPDSASSAGYATLQKPTSAEQAVMTKYDSGGSFPFVDVGNRYSVVGAQYLPTALAKLTWAQVAAAMRDPGSVVARDVDGAANDLTAAICKVTNGQPGAVCSSAGAKAGAGAL